MRNLRTEQEIMANWKGDISTPIVSVCCITYNHEPYIEDALEGFLIQETNFPFEIIIHDDASSDKTAYIIQEYAVKYPNLIKLVLQINNQYKQKKFGFIDDVFNKCIGKYIALCEGDDYWIDSKKLTKQLTILENNKKLSTSVHRVHHRINNDIKNEYYDIPKNTELSQKEIILKHYIPTCSVFIKSKVVKNHPIGRFIVADIPLSIIASKEGNIFFSEEIMGVYRKNPNSITHNKEHLKKARNGMILMYIQMFKYAKPQNYIYLSYKIIRLLAGYFKK